MDVIITDPPFGSNVQYGEQTDLWVIWVKDILGLSALTDKENEAIMTRRSGFSYAKSLEFYEEKLHDNEKARLAYQKVISNYPHNPEREEASQGLERLSR